MQNEKERENRNGLIILLVPLKLKAERILQSLYMIQNFILFYMDVTEKKSVSPSLYLIKSWFSKAARSGWKPSKQGLTAKLKV